MIFELRQYDTVLLVFSYEREKLGAEECRIIEVKQDAKCLLPMDLGMTDIGLMKWLSRRVIPQNRTYVNNLLSKFGLAPNDTIGIISICYGLSLNDSYWILPEGANADYAGVNLYHNNISKALSLVAYTGHGDSKVRGFTSSPEFTTGGMLKKGWRRSAGVLQLYKGGTFGAANAGMEPYSEYYAAQIARAMNVKHIEYNLAMWKKELCSTCDIFTDIDHSYMPIGRIVREGGIKAVAKYYKELGESYYNEFVDMLVFDAVIFNEDRHFGNFGLLVDNKTNKVVATAPIFDNGISLFNYAMDSDIANLTTYAKTRYTAYGDTFEDVVREFISDRQREKLRKLLQFKFEKHTSYNMSAKRLKIIQNFIQERIRYLLSL